MDTNNDTDLAAWAGKHLRALDPPASWQPDTSAAHARVKARLRDSPTGRPTWGGVSAVAGSVVCVLFITSPSMRATATQLWRTITMSRVDVVRVDFDVLPDEASSLRPQTLVKPDPPRVAHGLAEAQARVGFAPRLPQGILGSPVRLSTMGALSIGTVLRVSDVHLALSRAGIRDEIVPNEWDGAQLVLSVGKTVVAEWPEISLTQGVPPALVTPPNFDFGSFARVMLRAAGMARVPAEQYGRRMAVAPALLFGIGVADDVMLRDVKLHQGRATMMQSFDDDGHSVRMEMIWAVADRVYLLSGMMSQDQAVAIANAVQ